MSLFRGILGGAMVGGGQAWQVVSRDEELARQRMALEAAREKAAYDRSVALEGMRHSNNKDLHQLDHTNRTELEGNRQRFEGGILDKKITAEDTRAGADRRSREQISADDNKAQLDAARLQLSREKTPQMISTADGRYIQVSSDGTAKEVKMGGEPIKGPKDMDQRTLKLIDSMQSNRDLLIRNDPMGTNAPEVQRINKEIQTLIRGGNGETSQLPVPSGNAVANLGKFKDDPGAILAFDRQYGTGAAARALGDSLKAGEKVDLTKQPTGLLEGAGRVVGETVEGAKKAVGGVLGGNDANRPGWKEPVLNERDLSMQREADALRERQARDAARVSEMRDLIQPDRIRSMSPEEARAVLETYDTRLPGKAKAMLRDRLK